MNRTLCKTFRNSVFFSCFFKDAIEPAFLPFANTHQSLAESKNKTPDPIKKIPVKEEKHIIQINQNFIHYISLNL